MKYLFTTAILAASLLACNSNGDKTAENKDTSMNHETHSATTTTAVEMPPMPEVPAHARVFFGNLKDGQVVTSPLKVEMGVEAMSVDTANGILKPASGHHHILVDMDSIQTGEVIKKDSVHIHFGNAQTSAEISLPPGKHSLTLQFADALHRSYGSRLTSKVTVEVKQ
ncbi:MAG TPA: DUF4399 domain-containing protein [Chitinophagaceae bacterium]|nr:DUF4399 domain-containing protein [Chitinophagaceae bacterium]